MAKTQITYTATNPRTGETVERTTTRTTVRYFTFLEFSDGYAVTMSAAADEKKAISAGRSSNPYARSYTAAPATRKD